MEFRQHQGHISVFRAGPVGRSATVLLAAALFILVFVFGALVAAMAAAAGVVVWTKLWWSNRRKVGNQGAGSTTHVTLEGDYQVLPSERTHESSEDMAELRNGE